MPSKRSKKDVDAELDLHGLTVEEMRVTLQNRWPEWRGMRTVRIIHGRGAALKPAVVRWCKEMGIACEGDDGNPGSTRIFPAQRELPDTSVTTSLREKGLSLTPEEEAYLRDPLIVARARQEEAKRRQEELARRRAEEMARGSQRRRDEALWQAEVARLDSLEKKRTGALPSDSKPNAPRVLPAAQIKYQEGYWRAELVRVADTDTDTLKKQKRTGLDKLEPPLPPAPTPVAPASKTAPRVPQRDVEADRSLFEAEMARLEESEPGVIRRAKRE